MGDHASTGEQTSRRSFLGGILALGTSTVGAILAIPLARLVLDPLWRTTSEVLWSDAGPARDFAAITAPVKVQISIEQRDGWRKVLSEKAVYVLKDADGKTRVLSAVCPHLDARSRGMTRRASSSARAITALSRVTERS